MPIQFTDQQIKILDHALNLAHQQYIIYDDDDYEELYGESVRDFEKMMEKIKKYRKDKKEKNDPKKIARKKAIKALKGDNVKEAIKALQKCDQLENKK